MFNEWICVGTMHLKSGTEDGNITPVLYNASVYKDESGEVIGIFAAARDITERKKAEEFLANIETARQKGNPSQN